MRTCRVSGCVEAAAGFGAYCSNHKARARRHGHPEQEGIGKAELAPYVALVERRIEKNQANPLWPLLYQRWAELVAQAEGVLAVYHGGKPSLRHEVQAAHEMVKLTEAVGARGIVVAGLAMFVLRDQQPQRFKSDGAFSAQLVRRLRGLTEVNAGTWFDHQSGRVKKTYREVPPRVASVLSLWVVPVVGAAGLKLAELERRDRDADQQRQDEFRTAMEKLS